MPSWSSAHDAAVRAGEPRYIDPDTGYQVFTQATLEARGRCCGSGCRHCPYGHERVRRDPGPRAEGQATWRRLHVPAPDEADVLFWSGGKDAWLAWLALRDEAARPTILLTTHEVGCDWVPHQEVELEQITDQAEALDAELITVPVGDRYTESVHTVLDTVHRRVPVRRVVFGDLHLRSVRDWRAQMLRPWLARHPHSSLHFPLWNQPYDVLVDRLEREGAAVVVTATRDGTGQTPGQPFAPGRVPDGVDVMGENGEFHTLVHLT